MFYAFITSGRQMALTPLEKALCVLEYAVQRAFVKQQLQFWYGNREKAQKEKFLL